MKKQIVVIHGGETFETHKEYLAFLNEYVLDFDRTQQTFWKDTFAEKLGNDYEVIFPRMPNALNAKYFEWKIWFEKYLPHLRNGVVLVGHSLGGIFLAKYLSENTFPKKILGTFLIAAPHDAEGAPYSLADFVLPDSLALMEKQGGEIYLFQSKDDPVVQYENVLKYQKDIPTATLVILEDRQHFTQTELLELIQKIHELEE